MSFPQPTDPAPNGYIPNPYTALLEIALAKVQTETTSSSGWSTIGTQEDVLLEKKYTDSGLPIVRGKGVVQGTLPREMLQAIALPGCRERWDARFETGFSLEKYAQSEGKFYTGQKGTWPVSGRDIVGAQATKFADDGSWVQNVQTSVPDTDQTPPVNGKVRATLDFAGWTLMRNGDDTEVTYVVHINLNGSIPAWIQDRIATEIPLCVAKARDFYLAAGAPPLVSTLKKTELCQETFTFDKKEWQAVFLSKGDEEFNIAVDEKRMFRDGWEARLEGDEAGNVQLIKRQGELVVKVAPEASGKKFELVVGPASAV
ncbi:Bet v1-like protein [Dacryopinax primogenitus]|uniref:Bet v1-like protein n=1 Tax=Dacryopinax primogenitus (strain DJM 731) TaxID=1858805 RepID=M5G8G5_DACPD|nr:Bet v1-like protein [Dacryopinax primogenitus]EJU06506.1 Bet v1-like protein [Dacryopinax primogenitus]